MGGAEAAPHTWRQAAAWVSPIYFLMVTLGPVFNFSHLNNLKASYIFMYLFMVQMFRTRAQIYISKQVVIKTINKPQF